MNSVTLLNEHETITFGKRLAALCSAPFILFLQGELGAGKTTLARGFLRGLGYEGRVKSPTFTLVEPYEFSDKIVYHFDLYRLHDAIELESIGVRDYFTPQSICLIEWPEKAKSMLPNPDLNCYIRAKGDTRIIEYDSHSDSGRKIIKKL